MTAQPPLRSPAPTSARRLSSARRRLGLGVSLLIASVLHVGVTGQARTEALVIGRANFDQRPSGKEADGIVGDFVLRNNMIEALISGTQPLRRASTATGVSPVAQGVLFDLDIRGEQNDQMT